MNIIKKFFKAVVSLFTTPSGQKRIEQALSTTYDLIQVALPVVELVAALTPTRADDEIVALVRKYALPLPIPTEPMNDTQKGSYLKTAAVSILRDQLNDRGIPDSILDTAVQVAFVAFKAGQERQ